MMLLNYVLPIVIAVVESATEKQDPIGTIINGDLADIEDFPYQVFLMHTFDDDSLFCGGSIITLRHILSAAHCLFDNYYIQMDPSELSVVAGQTFKKITRKTIYRNVSKILVHENYTPEADVNDISILILKKALPSGRAGISPIALQVSPPKPGRRCFVSGWGTINKHYTGYTRVHYRLLAATIFITTEAECNKAYNRTLVKIEAGMMCAWNKVQRSDSCQGDSGGPLACNGVLTGIVSTGMKCADPVFPGIYTNVSHFVPWIKSVLVKKNKNVDKPKKFTKGFLWSRSTKLRQRKLDSKIVTGVTKPDIDFNGSLAALMIRSKEMLLLMLVLSIISNFSFK